MRSEGWKQETCDLEVEHMRHMGWDAWYRDEAPGLEVEER
jgi:hypothetical protein